MTFEQIISGNYTEAEQVSAFADQVDSYAADQPDKWTAGVARERARELFG